MGKGSLVSKAISSMGDGLYDAMSFSDDAARAAVRIGKGSSGIAGVRVGNAAGRHGGGMSPAIVPPVSATRPTPVIPRAVANAGRGKPSITMPSPRLAKTLHPDGLVPGAASRGKSAISTNGAIGMSTMAGIGMGALAGGTASWASGGSISQGALVGGLSGAALGMGGGGMAARGIRRLNVASGKAGYGYSRGLSQMMKGMENPASRAYMFGAGGMLGGFMFGGNKSHKRGFNSKRGNSIGR